MIHSGLIYTTAKLFVHLFLISFKGSHDDGTAGDRENRTGKKKGLAGIDPGHSLCVNYLAGFSDRGDTA
jgi:hypothetical protein